MTHQRRQVLNAIVATLAGGLASSARAQAYPSRPLTIVVPYPPGASSDQTARLVQAKMQASFGQTVIVDNRGGANGALGARYLASSPPDGYQVLLATQPILAINPYLQRNMGFDPLKDLMPLTNAVNAVVALAVHSSLPVNNLADLIAYAKRNPGKLAFGSAGAGSPQHIGGLQLGKRAGIDWTHVPYRGGGPMLNDLLGGQVQVGIATLAVFKPFMSEGRLRVIAVGERTRFSGTPDIPTIAETLPGFELTTWLGFFGPTGIPAAVAGTLTSALVNALRDDSLRTKLADSALLVRADGPEALERVVRADYELYGRVIREYKITTD